MPKELKTAKRRTGVVSKNTYARGCQRLNAGEKSEEKNKPVKVQHNRGDRGTRDVNVGRRGEELPGRASKEGTKSKKSLDG